MYNKELEELIMNYGILEKAFDSIRLVDPTKKNVIYLQENKNPEPKLCCFEFWGNRKPCENCVALRAYQDNKTYLKLDYVKEEIYILAAIPVDLPSKRVIVELLKNVTDSFILDTNDSTSYAAIKSLLNKFKVLTMMDTLTGVYNKRYINEKLPLCLSNSNELHTNISIIMADIDFFKHVNDTYGHINGDVTLKKFAGILEGCLSRDTDWVGRFGGEEFLICLPGAASTRAIEIAEHMRYSVEKSVICCGDQEFSITASFGVATKTPEENLNMADLIQKADENLYKAKRNGRNLVVG